MYPNLTRFYVGPATLYAYFRVFEVCCWSLAYACAYSYSICIKSLSCHHSNDPRALADNIHEQGLETAVKESITLLHQSLEEHIYEAFKALIPQAVNSAVDTAEGWGAHKSLGGMYWYFTLTLLYVYTID